MYNLLIVNSALHIGGAEMVIQDILLNIDRNLFNVSICHLKERGAIGDDLYRQGYDIVGVPKSRIMKVDYFSFLKLLKIIKKKRIDIVHSHTAHSLTDSALCKIFMPGLRHIHTFHFGNYPHDKKTRMMMEKVFWRITDKTIAVGHEQKKQIKQTFKIPDDRITTIYNGVSIYEDTADTRIRELISEKKGIVIASLGSLYEQKGITYLIDVALVLKQKGRNAIFLIAGEGPLRSELEAKIQKLGLSDTVLLLGWVKKASSSLLPLVDVFFQPSLWEAMSIVLLEAMALGKPIVATNVGENGHVIDHGLNGFIVEPKDIKSMALLLEKLICDSELRTTLGNNAKQKYVKNYTANKMAENYEKIYSEVLKK